jgi:hypothetical protein
MVALRFSSGFFWNCVTKYAVILTTIVTAVPLAGRYSDGM